MTAAKKDKEDLMEKLYTPRGQLQVECDWLKKLDFWARLKRISLIDKQDKTLEP